ncbi:hypothetical protein E2C01_083849 [Portunus trituberculatus]|uniref:Uncharacterized protein n=1 Tax=Portunus trituberculatus TaxID=210409 RepID=A0A5B7J2E4_PORTR|nr:hypothetical protein [Portunus trituberculatus]
MKREWREIEARKEKRRGEGEVFTYPETGINSSRPLQEYVALSLIYLNEPDFPSCHTACHSLYTVTAPSAMFSK